jgi:hypothetical protein
MQLNASGRVADHRPRRADRSPQVYFAWIADRGRTSISASERRPDGDPEQRMDGGEICEARLA